MGMIIEYWSPLLLAAKSRFSGLARGRYIRRPGTPNNG